MKKRPSDDGRFCSYGGGHGTRIGSEDISAIFKIVQIV